MTSHPHRRRTGPRLVAAAVLAVTTGLAARAVAAEAPEVPDSKGATRIAFKMPLTGQATLALYTPQGRLVRILGQLLNLQEGPWLVRWDGMDLFGNLVPAGTDLIVKVFANPGIKAYYEFTVGGAADPPWLTAPMGEGAAMRTGGWMGDHTPPLSAMAFGDRVFLGCGLAEHGHAVIAVNLDGQKMWGSGGLEGWHGPQVMATDGQLIYCAVGGNVYTIDPATYAKKRLLPAGKEKSKGKVRALGAHGGKLYLVLEDDAHAVSLAIHDAATGALVSASTDPSVNVAALAFDGDGTLYTLSGNRLCKSELAEGKLKHTVLNQQDLKKPISIGLAPGRIVIGDDERCAVLLFDRQGQRLAVLGDRGKRKAGPWDPTLIDRPTGVALDRNGKVWVCENLYIPKRVARFNPAGACELQLFGPAEYGGGGFLDPDLKNFYYRSMQFALDFEKGTWALKNLNDRLGDPRSPALDRGSFSYTGIGRPIYYQGRRYIVNNPGGCFMVCILEGDTWRPCAVMAQAKRAWRDKQTKQEKSELCVLLEKEVWKDHWAKQDLVNKYFIWCDRNGDGKYQVDEVEVFPGVDDGKGGFTNPFSCGYWSNWCGPDLTFWANSARLAPSRFTEQGVPIYEAKNVQRFEYGKLAPYYSRTFTGSFLNGASTVAADGSFILGGQPYVVRPDLTLKGGPVDAKPSGYLPPIPGRTMDAPLHFVGTALTQSPVGEVGMLNGDNGRWSLVSLQDSVLLGEVFTGETGGWGTDLKPERGTDVTGRKHAWETFFGHFIKAQNGKYYTVAGHGFHAICRIENLDSFQVQQLPLKVTAEAFAANQELRPKLVALTQAAKNQGRAAKSATFLPLAQRTPGFKLDGDLSDWGPANKLQAIGDPKLALAFDGAYDKEGLYLAYSGVSALGNAGDDPRYLFKTGFCFDLQYRADAKQDKASGVVAGDHRLVFGPQQGRWLAVRYDYVDPGVPRDQWVDFTSPVVTTSVARVLQLQASEYKVAFRQAAQPASANRKDLFAWSAEVFVKWDALGVKAPAGKTALRCDFGILSADSGGVGVEKRTYWSNRNTEMVADLGVEARIEPSAWGAVNFKGE